MLATTKKKKKGFSMKTNKNLHWPMDVLEQIVTRGLSNNGRGVMLMMKCNKELCKRLQKAHALWRGLYVHWHGVAFVNNVPKALPNYHTLKEKDKIQPVSIEWLEKHGVSEEKKMKFNYFVYKIMKLVWVNVCDRYISIYLYLYLPPV